MVGWNLWTVASLKARDKRFEQHANHALHHLAVFTERIPADYFTIDFLGEGYEFGHGNRAGRIDVSWPKLFGRKIRPILSQF